MKTLKDMIFNDNENLFFRLNDFAETHNIEGREKIIVIDNDALDERKSGAEFALQESTVLFFIRQKDLPEGIAVDSLLSFDGKEYFVDDIQENKGISRVSMHQNRMT